MINSFKNLFIFDMEKIRLMIRKILTEELKPVVIYSAVVIEKHEDIEKIKKLIKKYVPINEGWRSPHMFHMTIGQGKFPESLYLRGDLNKEVTLTIISIGISGNAIALGTSGYYSKNDIPHITLAFQTTPADSKEIKNWEPIDNLSVTGIIREIGENNVVIK